MESVFLDAAGKHNASLPRPNTRRSGCTSLHTAVWQNRPDLVADLLGSGMQVDTQDEESAWTALHKALYWGHFRCAAVLLGAGAQLTIPDSKGRTPLDLLSEELKGFLEHEAAGLVYSWGNGANYQLGTGATGLQTGPVRLDGLRKDLVVQIVAAKFHSAAVTQDGRVFTWGFGRGGRLGHPEFDVHSESAIIVPRAITGLGRRQVSTVAVAKHHTAVVTTSCELFTWGSNRDGRLGYGAVDTQPTPRKVTSLKLRVTSVAVATKHTAILTDAGAIYSWGANDQGQLGYGTSDSASNAVPRQVEAMKGKRLVALTAAKRHMVVMTNDGDVYTWGHRAVTPRRVQLAGARDVQRAGTAGDVAFHKGQSEISRPHAIAIAAGAAHSCCLTRLGVVLAWRSWDPNLTVQEVSGSLAGKRVISIAAGKYRTAAVTDEGDVYMWEGLSKQHPHRKSTKGTNLPPRPDKAARRQLLMSEAIVPERVHGIKRVTKACVGEKHSLALQCWSHAPKQLRLPLLAEAAALPALTRAATPSPEDAEEMLALAQEDADWTAAADRAAGGGPPALESFAGSVQGEVEGRVWLGRDFWQGLEAAHQKIQAAAVHEWMGDMMGQDVQTAVPSLQRLCERSLAEHDVEPRTCLQIMEYADSCGAEVLKQYCLAVALSNMDTVLLEARGVLEGIAPHLLEEMEEVQRAQFEPACSVASTSQADGLHHLLTRRPTVCQGGGADESQEEATSRRSSLVGQALEPSASSALPDMFQERSFCSPEDTQQAAAVGRAMRNLKKKLQQIDALQSRQQENQLDPQQQAKLAQRAELTATLEALQSGCSLEDAQQAAQPAKQFSSASCDWLPRSSSNLSLDSSASKRKPRASKHRAPTSQLSRLSMTASDQHTAQDDTAGPDDMSSVMDSTHAQPMSSSSTKLDAERDLSSAADPEQSLAEAAPPEAPLPVPSAWQRPSDASAGFTISGFSTPQGTKATGTAWPSPSGGAVGVPAEASHTPAASPASGSIGSRAKPPRKGGLSMFLSGGLEAPPMPPTPPPPAPTAAPPAVEFSWGGASLGRVTSTASLRDIQSQEAASTSKSELRSTLSKSPSLLSGSRSQQPKSEGKAKAKQSNEAGAEPSWNQVPLEALVRKSSPIAMNPKQQQEQQQQQQPAEPQGPAWGGAVLGGSPPAEGVLHGGMPSLRDIQAQQQQVRESCSRSFGAAGSSPSSAGRDGFASYLQWRAGSNAPAAGTSPGALFPAGSSPHTRKAYAPSPQPNSKWYIQDERPVVALQDIQTEEYTRELQAQQEAAQRQAEAEKAAAVAAAKKAAKKLQRQRKQAKLRAAAEGQQNAAAGNEAHGRVDQSKQAGDAGTVAQQPSERDQTAAGSTSTTSTIVDSMGQLPAPPATAAAPDVERGSASDTQAVKAAGQANSGGGRNIRTRGAVLSAQRHGVRDTKERGGSRSSQHGLQHNRSGVVQTAGKPHVLEVRRPRKPSQPAQSV